MIRRGWGSVASASGPLCEL